MSVPYTKPVFEEVSDEEAQLVFATQLFQTQFGRQSVAYLLQDLHVGKSVKIHTTSADEARRLRNAVPYAAKQFKWGLVRGSTAESVRRAYLTQVKDHPDGTATLYVMRLAGVSENGGEEPPVADHIPTEVAETSVRLPPKGRSNNAGKRRK